MKPQKRKSATKKSSKSSNAWLVLLIAIPVLMLLFVAMPSVLSRFIPNSNLVSNDRAVVQRELKEQLELITLNDQIVLDGAQDLRCVDQSGFLEVRYVCNVQGWKYAKTKESPGGVLRQLDAKLIGSDYERLNFSGQSDAHYEAVFSDESKELLRYQKKGGEGVVVLVGYFTGGESGSDFTLRDLLKKSGVTVERGEVIYGVRAESVYLSCKNTSWIEAPCPVMPK